MTSRRGLDDPGDRPTAVRALSRTIAPWFAVTGRLVQARTAILVGMALPPDLLIAEAKAHMTPELSSSSAADITRARRRKPWPGCRRSVDAAGALTDR